jgi:hypothetical protein
MVRRAASALAGMTLLAGLSACELPFGLGLPTTRALESGAASTLSDARSFEISGIYEAAGDIGLPQASDARVNAATGTTTWSIDLQLTRPDREHVVVSGATLKVEAIIVGDTAYYRGPEFLSQHMAGDPLSRNLVNAAGNAWWKGAVGLVPRPPDLTDGSAFRTTFLGLVVTQRTDHVTVDGVDAVELTGPRADVFIAAEAPYRLLRVHINKHSVIDGIGEGDLTFSNYNKDFGIVAPIDVIDFSNLSSLPPIYTVVSVDTSGCRSPCVVSALIKNLGGINGASAPSTIIFTMTGAASGAILGTCRAQVTPDVGFNATTKVHCTIGLSGQPENAATVTASAENPGRA